MEITQIRAKARLKDRSKLMSEKNARDQLTLFGFFGENKDVSYLPKQLIHSNTISIYDALPKYNWSGRQPKESKVTKKCVLDDFEYEMTIKPAHIERVDPKTKEKKIVPVYPGVREEAVEDVLRFLAANGQGEMFGREMGVHFTVNEVVKELENINRSFAHLDVVEALMVCNNANLQVNVNGKIIVNSAIFPNVTLVNRENYKIAPSTRCFVRFHPMVTASVINLEYRMFNYRQAMNMKNPLARHIFKRMSHYWRQASQSHTYNFNLMRYLSQTPRNISPRMYRNVDAMNKALDELVKNEILESYEAEEVLKGKRIQDIKYVCRPHASFITDVKKANYVANRRSLYDALPELPGHLR